ENTPLVFLSFPPLFSSRLACCCHSSFPPDREKPMISEGAVSRRTPVLLLCARVVALGTRVRGSSDSSNGGAAQQGGILTITTSIALPSPSFPLVLVVGSLAVSETAGWAWAVLDKPGDDGAGEGNG